MPRPEDLSVTAASEPVQPRREIPLSDVRSALLLQALDYWRKLSAGRRYPSRTDVTPRGLGHLARNVALLRVTGDGDYEFRIVGDAHVLAHGVSLRGERLGTLARFSIQMRARLKAIYDQVAQSAVPYAGRGWIERADTPGEQIYSECVYLPLGPDDSTVDHLLCFTVYLPRVDDAR